MNNLKDEFFEIYFDEGPGEIIIKISGRIDHNEPSVILDPYFNSILEHLNKRKLTVDFKALNFMNSTEIISIIGFIKKLNAENIITFIRFDSKSFWQKNSFHALEIISRSFKNIKVIGV